MFRIKIFEELKQKKVFEVNVKANSSKNEINFNEDKKTYELKIKALPENNKANIEIIKFLQKNTGMNARIIKGLTSKKKTIKLF